MEGLIELQDHALQFDKPEGRVVEGVALIDGLNEEAVNVYYASTLPQFGWSRIGDNEYIRQGEKLRFDFEKIEEHYFFKIMISPH